MARPLKRPHRAAVTRMLRATGLAHVLEEAPLVELLRSLADEMDAGGGARTRADYLSALKDVRRVLRDAPGRPGRQRPSAPAEKSEEDKAVDAAAEGRPPTSLEAFKQGRGIA